ncbi:MAG: LysM peptidoglycan-binding domain-containing protein [Gammaproteobacteria bacterium]|nr:LysM peptidoglycan-binding domain-containing protein [Gammaproteobacteria bacterium]
MAMILPVAPARLALSLSVLAVLGGCSMSRDSRPEAPVTVPETVVENRFTNADDQDTYTAIVPRDVLAVEVEPDYPSSYTVVKGDTLWDISGKFLQKPWLWPQIWDNNPGIENPHLIYPGDQIALSFASGAPRFVVSRNSEQTNTRPEGSAHSIAKSRPNGTDYERRSPQIRAESLEDAIPTIPGDAIAQFLVYPRVVSAEQLSNAPYIVGNSEHRLTSAAGHQIYARGGINPNQHQYGIYRRSEALRDPTTGELLGYEVDHVGNAKLLQLGDPSTLVITDNKMETLSGDLLMASTQQEVIHSYIPRMPKMNGEGRIISLTNAIAQSGRNQIVVLNIGQRAGIQAGDVMAVERRGEKIIDRFRRHDDEKIQLPSTRTGVVMVFQTFDKVSYALVMESTRPIHINDVITDI